MAKAKIIVCFSIKGGVGKTFIAANLAAALTRGKYKKVLLIDFDSYVVGDMARMLDAAPTKSVIDLIDLFKASKQPTNIQDFLLHVASGVDFLAGILRPQQAPNLDPAYIKDVFNLFREEYDYIIVDLGSGFSDLNISILNEANLILLVANPDVLSISQTKGLLETLQLLLFPVNMVKIILNRAESLSSISLNEIQVALHSEIIAQIPSEGKVVMEAVNRGIPVNIVSPRSKVSRAIEKFAETLTSKLDIFIEHKDIITAQVKGQPVQKLDKFWEKASHGEAEGREGGQKDDDITSLKKRIHQRLIEELNLKKLELKIFSEQAKKELRERGEMLVSNILGEESGTFVSSVEARRELIKEILDEALGLGPLEELLADPAITDIMVNNMNEIYIERNGKIELTEKHFTSDGHVRTTIERIIAPIGRRIDESVPMVDARLPDGSRVNAIIPPLSLTGPTITIRKFRKERYSTEELISIGTLDNSMSEFLKACVVSRKNIIVSGGTGSGKTTILNILSAFVPENERIITIEDAAELKLEQGHWVRLESRPPNIEGKGAVIIRDLFRNTLRMRPDRIIIGECRGLESLDMLQAMNTGHDGSMTTIHANSTHDVLSRLDSMILMSGVELPVRAIREMIASAVDVIVHTARLSDGSRKILQVTEIAGMQDEMHIGLKDIFSFVQKGIDKDGKVIGEFKPTGYIPSFYDDIRVRGIDLPESIFKP
ncbi:MAG: pilus assembly protein TadA [Candidatus Omnitrophica bacterium]|nr:pilus assembly protein TadA [Candidatus Omnitrophota bacterium]